MSIGDEQCFGYASRTECVDAAANHLEIFRLHNLHQSHCTVPLKFLLLDCSVRRSADRGNFTNSVSLRFWGYFLFSQPGPFLLVQHVSSSPRSPRKQYTNQSCCERADTLLSCSSPKSCSYRPTEQQLTMRQQAREDEPCWT